MSNQLPNAIPTLRRTYAMREPEPESNSTEFEPSPLPYLHPIINGRVFRYPQEQYYRELIRLGQSVTDEVKELGRSEYQIDPIPTERTARRNLFWRERRHEIMGKIYLFEFTDNHIELVKWVVPHYDIISSNNLYTSGPPLPYSFGRTPVNDIRKIVEYYPAALRFQAERATIHDILGKRLHQRGLNNDLSYPIMDFLGSRRSRSRRSRSRRSRSRRSRSPYRLHRNKAYK